MIDILDLFYSSPNISERCENSFVNYVIYYGKLCHSFTKYLNSASELPRQMKEVIQIKRHSLALNQDQGLEIPSFTTVLFDLRSTKVDNYVTPSLHHWISPDENVCVSDLYSVQ